MTPPVFYLLAGPNGAGKSTLYRAAVAEGLIPADIEFVNADLFEAAELTQVVDPKARSEQARLWADRRRATLLAAGRSFVSETVFSHPSKLQLLADAQAARFRTVLLVVCVDDAQQLVRRVAQRVRDHRQGGDWERGIPDGRTLRYGVKGRYDPGYGSTSRMLTETGVALLSSSSAGMIGTPGAILGDALVRRLQAHAEITFAPED